MKNLVALTALTFAAATTAQGNLPDQPHIYVEGTAQVEIQPNAFTIEAVLLASHIDMALAEQELAGKVSRFVDAVITAGVDREQVMLSMIDVYPNHEWEDEVWTFTGYELSHRLTVKIDVLVTMANLYGLSLTLAL